MARKKLLLIIPPQKGLLKGFATGIVSLARQLSLEIFGNWKIQLLELAIRGFLITKSFEIIKFFFEF
ncbi:hypothetical protein [Mucilaginibacter boryungensis]|uniref:Uncharacterized protein n=1 Tax=Mucilaginibacter boryungensis TaxID=768480 RepID=A0ABR9XL33_9SPHI|nr:hypothetical protein [Mucilaginibacter boryungensis]MBE9668084.1 hypothetical protein [Mucilaginibacter boryungensis]